MFQPEPLDFDRDGRDWPNREASRLVDARGMRWHVQRMGSGPKLLLVHGTGASTHSFAALAPLLARKFDVVAFDLPGHGFTTSKRPPDLSLPGMARAVTALLKALDFEPAVVVGHSAGAAVLVRMIHDKAIKPALLVSLNGAFLPFGGSAAFLFPAIAKLLFLNPFAPRLFAWAADRKAVADLLRGTGSPTDARGVDLYARLLANPAHIAGALGMMANWDLSRMSRDLAGLSTRTLFVVGDADKAVSPADAPALARAMPDAAVAVIRHAGHLAHEEKPEEVCVLICAEAARLGVIAADRPENPDPPEKPAPPEKPTPRRRARKPPGGG